MRVLLVHTSYRQAGGEDAVVAAEAALLRAAGHEVVEHRRFNPEGAVPAAAALARSPWNPSQRRALLRAARAVRPDVAHVHNTWYAASPAVLWGLRAAGVPTVMTLHNYRLTCSNALLFRDGHPCTDCVGSSAWHGVRHRCYRDSTVASVAAATTVATHRRLGTWRRCVDVFLALTGIARAQCVAAGLPAERLRVKANAVPDAGARPAAPSASSRVLFVGRLSPEKGVAGLLDAWDRAAPPGLTLDVIGDGPQRGELEARGVPRVRFLGRLGPEEVRRAMLGARALVFPSRWFEGQPLVLLEAFSAGLPVLAADLGGAAEVVGGVDRGWLVGPGEDAWPTALPRLAEAGTLDAFGAAARRRYERCYTPEASRRALEEAYAEALGAAR